MCHIIFAGPVTTRPGGMVKAPAAAGLVTPSGLALRQQPGFLGTAFETVHLATIAMAADQYLCAAPPAEKQPGRHAGLIGATASAIRRSRVVFWTHPLLSAILIPHCAPARCRARRSVKLPRSHRRRACPQLRMGLTAPAGLLSANHR